jgi:tRNA U38,U39,U40 pseudouridine synthase TruA
MLWDDAKMCILLDRLDLFTRKPDILKKYHEYLNAMQRNGISVADIIIKKMGNHPIAWMRNEYPYDVEGTTHYLIWSTEPLSSDKINEIAAKHAGSREFIQFVNPENLKSVKEVWHAHVFILNY